MASHAEASGEGLVVFTSTKRQCPHFSNVYNFAPSLRMPMPFYPELDLAFPQKRAMEAKLLEINPDVIHVSTPGPVGLLGRKLAKKYQIPMVGTYHTDFPAYVHDNTGLHFLKTRTDGVMRWFYEGFSGVFTRSEAYGPIMERDIGIRASQVMALEAGTDTAKFHPERAEPSIHTTLTGRHDPASFKVLYVGRMSDEKSVKFLLEVWEAFFKWAKQHDVNAQLTMVGEGKYLKRAEQYKAYRVSMTGGIMDDEVLTKLYASSDLFIFPSVTDTLGQVVMEAQASGIPVLVSDVGGPQTLLNLAGEPTGVVVEAGHLEKWVGALISMVSTKEHCASMGSSAHYAMQRLPISRSYRTFFDTHERFLSIT